MAVVCMPRGITALHGSGHPQVTTGKRPLECWTDVASMLGIQEAPQVLLDKSEPLLSKM